MTKHTNGAITFEAEEIEQVSEWIKNNEWGEQYLIILIGIMFGFELIEE